MRERTGEKEEGETTSSQQGDNNDGKRFRAPSILLLHFAYYPR